MNALIHPRPAALLHSAGRSSQISNGFSKIAAHLRHSRSLADLLPALFLSGLLTAVVVAALQLTWYGPEAGFAAHWLENWLVAWAVAFPVAYFAGATLMKVANFMSTPATNLEVLAPGLSFGDITAASTRATERYGFTVMRNLKVREDFYRA